MLDISANLVWLILQRNLIQIACLLESCLFLFCNVFRSEHGTGTETDTTIEENLRM